MNLVVNRDAPTLLNESTSKYGKALWTSYRCGNRILVRLPFGKNYGWFASYELMWFWEEIDTTTNVFGNEQWKRYDDNQLFHSYGLIVSAFSVLVYTKSSMQNQKDFISITHSNQHVPSKPTPLATGDIYTTISNDWELAIGRYSSEILCGYHFLWKLQVWFVYIDGSM